MLKQTLKKTIMICAVVILAISQPAYAQITEFKLTASDATAGDLFGNSVSISGDYAIIGAHQGDLTGAAYIFVRDGVNWTQQAKLTTSNAVPNAAFGGSVSISGDYAIVGAFSDTLWGSVVGAAYIFVRDGVNWTQQARLTASDAAYDDIFGITVSISGVYAIIGARYDDDGGSKSGSAYVFVRNGQSWSEQAKLTASDAAANDLFGSSISISGDYAIVGAYEDDDDGNKSGSAYIFFRDGESWTEQAKLTASDAAAEDLFGSSVSINGNYAIIGTYLDDDSGSNSGSAYVFKRTGTTWAQEAKLLASDGVAEDNFGYSISINGDYTIIGARYHDAGGSQSGSAYIFIRDDQSWTQQAKLTASDAAADDYFARSVSISGGNAIVGAIWDDDGGNASGSAYVYNGFILPDTLFVTKTADTDDGVCDADCSLREAIAAAADGDIVDIPSGTYTLTLGSEIVVTKSLTLKGSETGSTIIQAATTAGTAGFRVFTLAGADNIISHLTIRHGHLTTNVRGAGLKHAGNLTILNCTISNNQASWVGGGIHSGGSDVITIINSTISDNTAGFGGAIFMEKTAELFIENSTFSNNSASYGGNIYHYSDDPTPPQLTNTILAKGVSGTNCLNNVISNGYNIDDDGSCGFSGTGDISNTDPILGSLQDNGGPTFTNALLAGSPAIDAGDDATAPEFDQRGYGRNGVADMGAFEYNGVAPVNAVLSVSLLSIDFGDILVGGTTTEPVTVKNTGTADLNVSSIGITGDDSLNFSVDTNTFTLSQGDSTVLNVSFTPDDTGSFSASLDFESDGGDASVALTGIGFEVTGDYALEFDGVDDYVEVTDNTQLRLNDTEYTIELWVYQHTRGSSGHSSLLSKRGTGSQNGWIISITGSLSGEGAGKPFIQISGGADPHSTGNSIIPLNHWTHIAWVYTKDDSIIITYVESNLDMADTEFPQPNGNTTVNLFIGDDSGNPYNFDGLLDEIRIWNVARTQEEIQADMSHHLDGTEEGLVGYWRMDEGSGQTLVDWSVNGNDGQLGSTAGVDDNDPAWLETDWPYGSPELLVSPLSIDFGDVIVEETTTEPITVSNTGTADLTVSSIAITGDDPENFSVAPVPFTTIPFTLVPGGSQILEISLTPDTVDSLSALLQIDSDGGSGGVALVGNGIAFPVLSVTPLSIDFGAIPEGDTAIEQVTVTNTGTADLNVSSIAITSADSGNFNVDTTTFTLAPDDSQILDVSFSPDQEGSFSASLEIESDSGSVSIDLGGVGVDPIPLIISITDVPDDQGRLVHLSWLPSGFDDLGEITQYGIWEFSPEDEWVSLGNVPSIQADHYTFLAITYGDSTDEGIFWSAFMVTAHTTDPEVYFTSAVDSGYSVDNLAPAVPTGLLASVTAENTVALSWDEPVDEDFDYFNIYRSLEPDFDPTGLEPFAETIDTTFIDSDVEIGETYYYILSAVDFNGNESEYTDVVEATVILSIDDLSGIPTEFGLHQNYPNPFNPVTTLRYDLPEQVYVTLVVYDLLGREVKRLVSGRVVSGYHKVVWDGTNNTGESVSAGVYLYRISTDKFTKVNKMILLR